MAAAAATADSTSTLNPTATDDASGGIPDISRGTPMKTYLFAFLGVAIVLLLFIVAVLIRRTKLARQRSRRNENEVDLWDYHNSRSEGVSPDQREEGLDANGEAPPPYAPPQTTNEGTNNTASRNQLTIPSQTLSRLEAGLKPPEYAERSGG
ncbi:uncharacterized protein RCC_08082 [Ramularia collo-cygni]|uniref:Uncharacterized protein n=1 Tax=Ramularia collo-cygni TaxID=112498 RepID=A0A2D3VLQ1_9PEZI|nr:uncharacterized protein RCC_08082 [Ramularia collo-cygni]CZT22213.1 uncharacterized protein RCC_08082 [Ramularia collo-cygni]